MNDDAPGAAAATHPATSRSPLYATLPGPAASLRVVLVAPRRMPAWLLRFLGLAAENPWMELVVLPIDGEPAPAAVAPPLDLRALLRYERRHAAHSALARVAVDSHDGVAFAPVLQAGIEPAALRARVTALRPDLVLLLGAPHWAEALGDRAQWGCWDFDASLTDAHSATQALLAPVMRGDVATPIELQLHHLDRPLSQLALSWGSTCRASASLQCEKAFLKVPVLLMRALRQLANGGLQVPPLRAARLQLASSPAQARWGDGIRTFARTLAFRFAVRWRRLSQPNDDAWQLLIRQSVEPIDPDAPAVREHAYLSAPGNKFWADPCPVQDAGRRFLFVEQWADGDAKGVIACLELLPNARVEQLGVILDQTLHLSYPQPFRWEADWYLTVESGHDSRVGLYRAESFPLRWERVTDLVSSRNCVDPTLHHHEGHWYLFAAVAESCGSTSDELFLFVADDLTGPFRPHPANPIVSDVRRARPAGRLFQRGGRLIRPAQDCAPRYGAAVVFNEVLELSPTHYRERPLGRLDSHWASGLDGCHTYNEADGIEVLDVRGTPPVDAPRLTVVDAVPAGGAGDHGVPAVPEERLAVEAMPAPSATGPFVHARVVDQSAPGLLKP